MSQLNEFQLNCEKALVSALGIPIADRKIAGVSERYIAGFFPGTELKIFIHVDGAEIMGRTVDERFEHPDYDSLGQLQHAFVVKAVVLHGGNV